MKFYPVDELKSKSRSIIDSLTSSDDAVITDSGKPAAIMLKISNDNFDEFIQAITQAKAMTAINLMRQHSAKRKSITEEEIEAEIAAVRRGE